MNKLFFFIFLVHFNSAIAQQNLFHEVKDVTAFRNKLSLASQQLKSVESDFSQVKNLSMLKDRINSSGKFYYQKGNKIRIEYTKPFYYLMILNDQAMMVKDEQKKSNINTRSNKIIRSINSIMIDCMSGNVYNNKEFTTAIHESGKEYLLILTPATTMMKKMFLKIEVYLSKQDFHVLRLNMVEVGGDNSLMTFTNQQINRNLDEKLFDTK